MNNTYSTYKEASEYAKNLAKQGKSVCLMRDGNAWVVSVEGIPKEHTPSPEPTSIWVGKFVNTGAVVVFDNSFKVEGGDNIYGYVPARDVMRQFEPNQKNMAHAVSGGEKDVAVSKYLAWKKQELAWKKQEVEREVERLEKKKQRAIQKHKEYLLKIGKPFSGVNLETSKRHRVTHCYVCKESLDSDFHIECNECRWLICSCGACGCGYVDLT